MDGENEHQRLFRVAQMLQKAFRSATQVNNWESSVETCVSTLKMAAKLTDACLNLKVSIENVDLLHELLLLHDGLWFRFRVWMISRKNVSNWSLLYD